MRSGAVKRKNLLIIDLIKWSMIVFFLYILLASTQCLEKLKYIDLELQIIIIFFYAYINPQLYIKFSQNESHFAAVSSD